MISDVSPLNKSAFQKICATPKYKWRVENRGRGASESKDGLEYEMADTGITCKQVTAYLGHHYMVLEIYNSRGNKIVEEKFGVFVQ